MQITLLSQTKDPEITCAKAAWICTHTKPKEDFTYTKACNLVERVLGYGHESIAEHATFSVLIEGVSRACSHQLVRHRLASYSQQSQRYTKMTGNIQEEYFVTPVSIKTSELHESYKKHMAMTKGLYQDMLDARIPSEDARFILPNATQTSIVMTMNARQWRHFFGERLCLNAQWEIRKLATQIYKELYAIAPVFFQNVLKCGTKGECNSCKKIHESIFN